MSDKTRPQWLLPAGIGLLVVVLVAVALVREPVQLDRSTPEGTVQEYLQAIGDKDYDRALEILHPDEFEGCVAADIARSAPNDPFTASLEDAESERGDDNEVVVSVRMRFGTGGMFGSSWENWETFTLRSENGVWHITGQPWPHFHWECAERGDF